MKFPTASVSDFACFNTWARGKPRKFQYLIMIPSFLHLAFQCLRQKIFWSPYETTSDALMRQLVNPFKFGRPSIGLALFGCKNRPFYQICVFPDPKLGRRYEGSIIEQVGTFDPLPNFNNEKLVALNFGRIKYWIGERGARVSVPVLELLGLAGLLPIHPQTFIRAKEGRAQLSNDVTIDKADGSESQGASSSN